MVKKPWLLKFEYKFCAMKQEFVTSKGKVLIERNILFYKIYKWNFTDTLLWKYLLAFGPILLFLIILFEENVPKKYLHIITVLIIVFNYFHHLYDVVIKLSFSNRIPLERIVSFEVKEDVYGLEKNVNLKLKSGRIRIIPFRTLEKQYEPFIEFLSLHILQPQLA